jgi:hypothetical protein
MSAILDYNSRNPVALCAAGALRLEKSQQISGIPKQRKARELIEPPRLGRVDRGGAYPPFGPLWQS